MRLDRRSLLSATGLGAVSLTGSVRAAAQEGPFTGDWQSLACLIHRGG